ncbi:MAG: AAA family ATPase [Myxococcales bacterium]|nr:AAA family ATPase [Myxococcales bacterium]
MNAKERLERLEALWQQERDATHARFLEERRAKTLAERVGEGYALTELRIVEVDAAPGGRLLLWLITMAKEGLDKLRIGSGDPVRLWWDDPDSPEAVMGVVSRRRGERLGVMVDDLVDRLEQGNFSLDRDDPQVTFQRGAQAILAFKQAQGGKDSARLREIFFGQSPALFASKPTLHWADAGLNEPQQEAVRMALSAEDVALIHGPPGTGKTRTLVEVVVQAVRRGESVLATAASNTAVDNLAERLVDAGISLVRLGHPARVSAKIEAHTMDAKLEKTEEFAMARRWMREAREIRNRIERKISRGELPRAERLTLKEEARGLMQDARKHLKGAQEMILGQAQVICATAAGADSSVMGKRRFDLVVLDEATQAVDPLALSALSRARRVVMAGDPMQLPPTIIDPDAERQGLGETIFARLYEEQRDKLLAMLTIQYRMHETIMTFPSDELYGGALIAAEGNREHRLEQLPDVAEDPLRAHPLIFLDTAGKGWTETSSQEDPSVANPEQAERVAAEVLRLLGRGVAPVDVAVITPYYAQVRALRELLSEPYHQGLEIDTVDGFQGREKEAIIVDLVRSNDDGQIGFLKDIRRMNVALTRARRFLLVVGDSATLGSEAFYQSFLEYAQCMDGWLSAWDDEAPPFECEG